MSKTSMFAKLTAQPGRRDDLLAALAKTLPAVNDEPGTELYAINTDDTDQDVVWIFELYRDKAALDAHSSSESMKALIGDLGGVLGGAPMLCGTTPVSGKGIDV